MKKIIITCSLVLVLALSVLLTACGGNMNEEVTTAKPAVTTTETATEKATDNIIDDAES